MWYVISEDELYHHGIKGQKWGIRRFQNDDGSLTSEGKDRYQQKTDKMRQKNDRAQARYEQSKRREAIRQQKRQLMIDKGKNTTNYLKTRVLQAREQNGLVKQTISSPKNDPKKIEKEEKKEARREKTKKALKIGAGVWGVGAATAFLYANYKTGNLKTYAEKGKAFFEKGRNNVQGQFGELFGKSMEQFTKERQYRKDSKNASTFNDADLAKKIERLQSEKKLRELTNSTVSKGRSVVNGSLTKVAGTAITGLGIYALSALASGKIDREALGRSIFNGGAKKN